MPTTQRFRLILDKPRSATLNMAIDEMLVKTQETADAVPVLRLYSWDRPSISAGYFQDIAAIARRYGRRKKPVPVVRRITGGGIVFHGKDLTLSLCLKHVNSFLPQDTRRSYQKVNEAIYEGIKRDFPGVTFVPAGVTPSGRGHEENVCFEKPTCFDLVLDGKKVLGASQRRTAKTLLHQSAIFLNRSGRLLARDIVRGFGVAWGVEFAERPLSRAELARAGRIERGRYSKRAWAIPNKKIKD